MPKVTWVARKNLHLLAPLAVLGSTSQQKPPHPCTFGSSGAPPWQSTVLGLGHCQLPGLSFHSPGVLSRGSGLGEFA